MKTVLFVGGGIEAVRGIEMAKSLGYRAVVMDGNPQAPGGAVADDFICGNPYDEEEVKARATEYARTNPIDGVLTIGCDATLGVAEAAKALNLPGHTPETALLTTNKLAMKERLKCEGIPVPWFTEVQNLEHLHNLADDSGYGLVLKPVDSRGARGVVRLSKSVGLDWAYEHSLSHSNSGRIIVERWIDGPQISTESVIWDSRSVLCGVADRDYSRTQNLLPFVIEDGGETPSSMDEPGISRIDELVISAARALGVKRGTVKGDIVMDNGKPKIIEIAARLSGGYFCTHSIPAVYGINLVEVALKIATGEEPDWSKLRPEIRRYAGNRYLFLPEGRIKSIANIDDLKSQPWMEVFQLYVKEGDDIRQVTDHTKRSGVVICTGKTKSEAIGRAEDAIAELKRRIEYV